MQKAIAVETLSAPVVLAERSVPKPELNKLLVQVTATSCKCAHLLDSVMPVAISARAKLCTNRAWLVSAEQ